ncbi:GGDEF domain-containing protein [Colwelliaceae bacterium 6471]
MHQLKNILLAYLKTGISEDNNDEKNRKIFIINLFGFVGMLITMLMAINAIVKAHYTLAALLFFACSIFYLGRYIQKVTQNYQLSSSIILYSLFILMFYLIQTGGVNNTGPLWIFMVAPVALFIDGLKKGLFDIAIFLMVIATLLFFPEDALLSTSYTTDFKLRLIYSFLTVTFLSSFYEHSRQQSYRYMQEISQKYEELSKIDPLTHLANRRDALTKLSYEQRRIKRNNSTIGIILCDIDYFKRVNDAYGHEAGDLVLVKLAQFMSANIREQDTLARWGGEEFLFIFPDTNKKQADIFAHKLHHLLKSFTVNYKQQSIQITLSMGVNEININDSITEAIRIADNYLYQAKEAGRDQIFPKLTNNKP